MKRNTSINSYNNNRDFLHGSNIILFIFSVAFSGLIEHHIKISALNIFSVFFTLQIMYNIVYSKLSKKMYDKEAIRRKKDNNLVNDNVQGVLLRATGSNDYSTCKLVRTFLTATKNLNELMSSSSYFADDEPEGLRSFFLDSSRQIRNMYIKLERIGEEQILKCHLETLIIKMQDELDRIILKCSRYEKKISDSINIDIKNSITDHEVSLMIAEEKLDKELELA